MYLKNPRHYTFVERHLFILPALIAGWFLAVAPLAADEPNPDTSVPSGTAISSNQPLKHLAAGGLPDFTGTQIISSGDSDLFVPPEGYLTDSNKGLQPPIVIAPGESSEPSSGLLEPQAEAILVGSCENGARCLPPLPQQQVPADESQPRPPRNLGLLPAPELPEDKVKEISKEQIDGSDEHLFSEIVTDKQTGGLLVFLGHWGIGESDLYALNGGLSELSGRSLTGPVLGSTGNDLFLLRGRTRFAVSVRGAWIDAGAGEHDVLLYDGGSLENELGEHASTFSDAESRVRGFESLAFMPRFQAYGVFSHALHRLGHDIVGAVADFQPPSGGGLANPLFGEQSNERESHFHATAYRQRNNIWTRLSRSSTHNGGTMVLMGVDNLSTHGDYHQNNILLHQGSQLRSDSGAGELRLIAATHFAGSIITPVSTSGSQLYLQGLGAGIGVLWQRGGLEAGISAAGTGFALHGRFDRIQEDFQTGYHVIASLHTRYEARLTRRIGFDAHVRASWQSFGLDKSANDRIVLDYANPDHLTLKTEMALKITTSYGGHALKADFTYDGGESYLITGMSQRFDPTPQIGLAWGVALTRLGENLLVWSETGLKMNLDDDTRSGGTSVSLRWRF